MALLDLVNVVSPPEHPVGNVNQRDEIEQFLNLTLPDDFWEFGQRYGSGEFNYFEFVIHVFNPYASVYKACVAQGCESLRMLKESKWSSHTIPYEIYPISPGLFPIGWDVNGNTLFWLMSGNANSWSVLAWPEDGGAENFQRFDMPLTTFLSRVFNREITCTMWADAECVFEPDAVKFRSHS